jgi:hypothetical protein
VKSGRDEGYKVVFFNLKMIYWPQASLKNK